MSVRLDNLEAIDIRPIRRALVSVYDKTDLVEFAHALHDNGVEIVSTGSTASTIANAGIPVTPVDTVTGFPEVLEGRVKTLHPHIHAGILADQRKAEHRQQLQDLNIAAFDLVVCNLYPFEDTVASGASFDECVEHIDIGGPSMVRAAAKNHPSVLVVTDPNLYPVVIDMVTQGGSDLRKRRDFAGFAFQHTAEYDTLVSAYFAQSMLNDLEEEDPDNPLYQELVNLLEQDMADDFPDIADDLCACGCEDGEIDEDFDVLTSPFVEGSVYKRISSLRYGENPHQRATVYRTHVALDDASEANIDCGIANAVQLHGKDMSYNNYIDGDAALRAAYDHERPCVAIIKHANPCGIAVADDVAEAHRKAHACDPVSAFGGVIAVNRPVTVELAQQIAPIFTEVVIAPAYEDGALDVLATKKNLRVLQVVPPARDEEPDIEIKHISGGLLIQERDNLTAAGDSAADWTLVAGEAADEATLADLEFAWRSVRAVRSNAIIVCKDGASVGVGMGQVNRVDSCKLAVERANTLGGRSTGDAAADVQSAGGARAVDVVADAPERRTEGAVAASDAFFPFADGLQILIDAGVKAVVQPGGSVRDDESIAAAQAAGITMYLTGTRHFSH